MHAQSPNYISNAKNDFSDSLAQVAAQRLAIPSCKGQHPSRGYWRMEGRGLANETDKTESHEKSEFSGENPAVRMNTVLGCCYEQTFA
jgi:hypothetical protein